MSENEENSTNNLVDRELDDNLNGGEAAVSRYHTHSVPLDMDDIERDWDTPVAEASLAAKASVILRVGTLDLGSGTGSFRVREMMHRIAYPLGVHVRADVGLTDVEASFTDGHERLTEVIDLPTTGVNTERIWLLEHYADWFNVNLGKTAIYHVRPAISEELVERLGTPEAKRSAMRAVQQAHRARERAEKVRAKSAVRAKRRGFKPPKGQYAEHFDHVDGAYTTEYAGTSNHADQFDHADHSNQTAGTGDHANIGDTTGRIDVSTDTATRQSSNHTVAHIIDVSRETSSPHNAAPQAVKRSAAQQSGPQQAGAQQSAQEQPQSQTQTARTSGTNGITVRQAHERLSLIEHRKPLYAPWFSGLASAIACAAFVFLLGGGLYDMIGAFVGAGIGQWLRRRMFARHLNQFFVTFAAVAAAALACIGTLRFIGLFDPAALRHDTAYIGAMLFVIPGFPLITGGLDIAKINFPSGLQRLFYALSIIVMATLAGWMVATVVHLNPQGFEPMNLNPWINGCLRFVAAFCGVWGFSVLFNSPQRMALVAATIGAVTDTLRLTITDFGVPPEAAAFLSALLAGLLASAWRSAVRHGFLPPHLGYPRICLTVPAIVIMVPGMYMYRAMFYLGQFDTLDALNWAFRAFMVILCLPIGLAMARVLTDRTWRYDL